MYVAEIFIKRDQKGGKTRQIDDYLRHDDPSLDLIRDLTIIALVITIKIQTDPKRLARSL